MCLDTRCTIVEPLEDQKVAAYTNVTLSVVLSTSRPVTWFINERQIYGGKKYKVCSEELRHSITIVKVTSRENGIVRIKTDDRLESECHLRVEGM